MAERTAAILTIRNAPNMTKRGRKLVADWMRRCADTFEADGQAYSLLFTARYLYDPEKPRQGQDFAKGLQPPEPA